MADDPNRSTQQLRDEFESLSVELERIDALAGDVAQTLTNGFKHAIVDGRSLQRVLGDVAKSFADIALTAALKPVGVAVEGFVNGLFNAADTAVFGGSSSVASAPQAGAAVPAQGAQPTTVNFNVTANDARSFVGAEAEVSAMLLRAVKRGTRAS
jgi:hypothetical protein